MLHSRIMTATVIVLNLILKLETDNVIFLLPPYGFLWYSCHQITYWYMSIFTLYSRSKIRAYKNQLLKIKNTTSGDAVVRAFLLSIH